MMLPRWLVGFRAFALACAFAAAFVPIATYITDDKRDWLWIHIGVNIAAYIAVALTTIYTTINLTQQDHNKHRVPEYWANNVVMRTWYLGVSKTWRWHMAAAVGRLGLALALAQHLHIVKLSPFKWYEFQGIFGPFAYYGYNIDSLTSMAVRSQWETTLIGFLVLIGFAILETALLTAFTLIAVKFMRNNVSRIFVSVTLRIGLFLLILGALNLAYKAVQYEAMGLNVYRVGKEHQTILTQGHKVAFTWLDNGTMLATWIMRPMTHAGLNYACIERDGNQTGFFDNCLEYDNRLWVLTDVLVGLVSYAAYIILIGTSLHLAHYLHWRREQRETPTPAPTTP